MSCSMAFGSGIALTMGQLRMSGSPSKYICVISRCEKLAPKTETWMCAGRQLLIQLRQG